MPKRLRPTGEIAADAILVGDPGRALLLAQELLVAPKMSNHARGLWGYGGETIRGSRLTIQSTGMGGPSAGLVLTDLAELGVRRAIRIGTATAVGTGTLGELLLVERAHFEPARNLEPRLPDRELAEALADALPPTASKGAVVSLDVLHHPADEPPPVGAAAADMQTAGLFAAGAQAGVAIAAILILAHAGGDELDDDGLQRAAQVAGAVASDVLSPST